MEPPPPVEPPPVTYTLAVNRTSIENGQVIFDLSGNPLPLTVYLQIESPPAGISFGTQGSGTCIRVSDVLAQCTTAPPAPAVLAPLARAVSLATSDPVRISMPFAGAPEKDTPVTVSLQAPLGTELASATVLYDVPEAPTTADVGLSGFPSPDKPSGVHDYVLSGQLDVTDYTGDVLLTLSDPDGRARFADSVAGCERKTDQTVTCPAQPVPLTLPLYVQDNRNADTTVTLTVSRADGGPDSVSANDSVTVVLPRYIPTPVDVAVAATAPERGQSGKSDVSVVVTASDAKVPVTLTATYDPEIAPAPAGCTTTTTGAECTFSGSTTLTFSVEIAKIKNEASAGALAFSVTVPEEYVDTKAANDSAHVTVSRFQEDRSSTSGTSGTTSLLRTASDGPQPAPDLVDQRAGSTSKPSATLSKSAPKVNLLSEVRPRPATKADHPAKKRHAKADHGKHKATGHDGSKDGSKNGSKNDKPAKAKHDNPAPGNGHNGETGPGSSAVPGGTGQGKVKGAKSDPVQQVIEAVADLLP